MQNFRLHAWLLATALCGHCGLLLASELTPVGAERAGNADGTIPPWTGGLTKPPPGYDPSEHESDPYPDDVPIDTITAANLERFEARLSEGQRALFNRFPDTWQMRVYPTRRSAAYPEWVYDALQRNAEIAVRSTDVRAALREARVSSPFPVPRTAEEVVWNHVLRWRGIHIRRSSGTAAVTPSGRYRLVWAIEDLGIPYALPWEISRGKLDNLLAAIKVKWLQPSQLTGVGALAHESIDPAGDPRKIWRYLPELRQVVRQPKLTYDLPASYSDGLRTGDDFELFLGPPDAYEWELLGKKELYIPYNAYRAHSGDLSVKDLVGAGHLNPEALRYELHRVWVVEGTLRQGERHIYGKRVFYLDEDSWQIAIADNYDLSGKLLRLGEAHAINYYTVPTVWATLYTMYDLEKHRYLVEGLDNERQPAQFSDTVDSREFTPNALNYYVR